MASAAPHTEGRLQTWEVKEPYLNAHCLLGEGPYYERATNTLRFIDIKQKQVLSLDLAAGPKSLRITQLDSPIGVTADIEGVDPQKEILVALKHGLATLDRRTGQYKYISQYFEQRNDRLRANDGGVDPHGRLWLGTMTDFPEEFKEEGYLLRLDGSSHGEKYLEKVKIPNTIGWSPDRKTQYFTSTDESVIYAWDYAVPPGDGAITNKRVFYRHEGAGNPDGFSVDVEGNLWHAVYGGACVLKISPQGTLVGKVTLPTKNITCTVFVGTELFITTAADETGEGQSKEFGGALFRVDVGTTGLEALKFKLAP